MWLGLQGVSLVAMVEQALLKLLDAMADVNAP